MAYQNVPGSYPMTGNGFNLQSIQFAPGNHNNNTMKFIGKDQDGNEIASLTQNMSTTDAGTVTLNFNGIHELDIVDEVRGSLDPAAAGPIPAHWYGGIVNVRYQIL